MIEFQERTRLLRAWRESRFHIGNLGSRGSPVPLDCMRPDGAWAHACCRHGECAWESDIRTSDLGQRCMWACAVMLLCSGWSREDGVEATLYRDVYGCRRVARLASVRKSSDLSYPVFLYASGCLCCLSFHAPDSSVRLNHERAGYGPYAADTRRPRRRSTHDRSTGRGPAPGRPEGKVRAFKAHMRSHAVQMAVVVRRL